ncbi:helix-turn-helix domain-containing protein [Staphylococcus pseudintermedius]|nr:helix-turn-helix domain-containing protein [Staphylococcus pseudintermedius]
MVLDLKRLRAERIACGITQDEMANLMGWKTRTPYAKRENGLVDIGANEFIKMAKILGYETNNLDIFFYQQRSRKRTKSLRRIPWNKLLTIEFT